jgi:hypothetical protein
MHAYEHVIEDDDIKLRSMVNYLKFMELDPSSASYNMQEFFREFSDNSAANGYDWYEMNSAASFWTRRAIDKNDKYFYDLLTLMIESYNRSFLERQ